MAKVLPRDAYGQLAEISLNHYWWKLVCWKTAVLALAWCNPYNQVYCIYDKVMKGDM
jgi:hypothetical protein